MGRERELAVLERHLYGEGPPLLLLAGEPGIGKTRLLHAALPRGVALGLQVLEGGCQRRGGQDPYAPLVGALQRYLRSRTPRQLRAELQGCAWLVRLLPELAAEPIPALPAWTVTPQQEQRLMGDAVVRLLTNAAGPAGTLLLLDDLQWASPDALDLLILLVRSAAEIPLRIIGTYRDTEVQAHDPLAGVLADLAQAGRAARRLLAPLTPQEAARLLDEVLGRGVCAEEQTLRARIVQRTGGVPFFVVSCAEALTRAGAESAPWDVSQSVRQRVAALPEAARDLAGAAAVMGRVVSRPLLAQVAIRPENEAAAALDALCQARLLEGRGDDSYQFAHDVIREVVEADLGAARRTLLHRRIAALLEQQGDPPLEALAYHYARTGERPAAAHWLERAGDRAAAGFANAAALEHYAAARAHLLAMGTDAAGVSRLDEKLGDLHLLMGDFPQAQDHFARARDAETQPSRRAELWYKEGLTLRWRSEFAPALAALAAAEAEGGAGSALPLPLRAAVESLRGEIYAWQGDYDAAEAAARRAMTLLTAETAGRVTDLELSSALWLQGFVAAGRGAHAQAETRYGEALALQTRHGEQELLHRTWIGWGLLAYDRGQFAEAEQCFRRGLAIGQRTGNQRQVAVCWRGLGLVACSRGDLALAEDYSQKGRALSERVGHKGSIIWAWSNLGRVALLRGDLSGAEACAQRVVALAAGVPNQAELAGGWILAALAACERGNLSTAARQCRAARRLGRQIGAPLVEAGATVAQAAVRLRQGHSRAAALLLARGRALAERDGWAQPAMQAALLQVDVLLCQGEVEAARRAAEAALERAAEAGRRHDAAVARRLLGQCVLAQGLHHVARSHLRTALAQFTAMGAALDAARTRLALATALLGDEERGSTGEDVHTLLAVARSQFATSGALPDLAQVERLAARLDRGCSMRL
ncbi:MAG: hypothetical protein NVSMB65_08680 [Chloroflexota bacterium]